MEKIPFDGEKQINLTKVGNIVQRALMERKYGHTPSNEEVSEWIERNSAQVRPIIDQQSLKTLYMWSEDPQKAAFDIEKELKRSGKYF